MKTQSLSLLLHVSEIEKEETFSLEEVSPLFGQYRYLSSSCFENEPNKEYNEDFFFVRE